jgi:murein DD-endopeptidase MepM/ murein hydrolase activator NlpD
MQIILLHSRLTSARPVTLTAKHLLACLFLFLVLVFAGAGAMYYATLQYAAVTRLPMFDTLLNVAEEEKQDTKELYMKENLSAMAMQMGEMQAQLMRLDALGERVQGLAGIKPEEFDFGQLLGRGGPAPTLDSEMNMELGIHELGNALSVLEENIEYRADYMNVVETALMRDRLRAKMLPTIQPVDVSYNASGFGKRFDPFNGRRAFHDGIDFAAPTGTPIVAAAGGVVVAASYHYQYGNMVDIDHGNDIMTRYAHASKLRVRLGDIVKRGEHIADIGSTGRSTGPHLHFEVRVKGVPQNPQKFLAEGRDDAKKTVASK